jgi:hypothetical protein
MGETEHSIWAGWVFPTRSLFDLRKVLHRLREKGLQDSQRAGDFYDDFK